MSKEWDRENMKTLGVNLKRETALKFQEYARANNTTVGALLRGYIESTLADRPSPATAKPEDGNGFWHLISYRHEDLLKRETAFYNPGGKNPNEMLGYVLDDYFRLADHFRRKGK